jgi:hypothetical protein
MDDDGTSETRRQVQLELEELMLTLARGEVVKIIESHFAEGNHGGVGLEVLQTREIFFGNFMAVVGVNADGAANVVNRPTQLDALEGIVNMSANRDHPRDARCGGAFEHRVELLTKARIGEMAMGVDHF